MSSPDTTVWENFKSIFTGIAEYYTPEDRRIVFAFLIGFGASCGLLAAYQTAHPENISRLGILLASAWIGVEAVLHEHGWWRRRKQPWKSFLPWLRNKRLQLSRWRPWKLLWSVLHFGLMLAVLYWMLRVLQPVGRLASNAELNRLHGAAQWQARVADWRLLMTIVLNFLPIAGATLVLTIIDKPRRLRSLWALRLFTFGMVLLLSRFGSVTVYRTLEGVTGIEGPVTADLVLIVISCFGTGAALYALLAWCLKWTFAIGNVGLNVLPLKLYDLLEQRAQHRQISRHKQRGLAGMLDEYGYAFSGEEAPEFTDNSKGARFATKQEIREARRPDGFAFGHFEGAPLFLDNDKHVLVMGSTRSGKGVNIIIPHLLRHRGSAFVLDPKGENARATGARREALNDAVHYLDPFGISGLPRARFNPLAHLTAENMEAGSKALAAALVINEKRDHWTASAQQLLAVLILHVHTSAAFREEERDLVTVRRLLRGAVMQTLEEMLTSGEADGLVADLAASFVNTPEKERGSIISTAQRETEILDTPQIQACLAAAGPGEAIDFNAWLNGTMSVFLCLSAPHFPVYNRWLRLVLTAALDTMTEKLRPPPLPVCFMLDELATLGHLQSIENAVGLSAGYGIQLVYVFQDIAQMRDLYKSRWASFIGNAGVRALFNLDDYDSAKYWSDFLGGRLQQTKSETQDIYGINRGQTAGEAMRPLLSPDQLMLRYSGGPMLVVKQGMHPVESERTPYWEDRTLQGLWRDPR